LLPDGILATKWGNGTWERDDSEPACLKLIFGSSCHVCRLDAGKFQVVKRISRKNEKELPHPKAQGVEVVSAGWPLDANAHEGKQRPNSSGEKKTMEAKQKEAEAAEEKLKVAKEAAVAAAEAAAKAAAKATEMEKLAKKAEAHRDKAVKLAGQGKDVKKEVIPSTKKRPSKDVAGEGGVPSAKKRPSQQGK